MFHVGKILILFSPKDKNIISSNTTVQATIKMWDDNIITGEVEPDLVEKVKVGDTVIVDYAPLPNTPAPRMTVTKILKGEAAKKIMKIYEEYYESKRKSPAQQQAPFPPHQQIT